MSRLVSICLPLIITFALLTAACAEGIQLAQPDIQVTEEIYAPLVSEAADELGEVELPTPEADENPSKETASSDEAFTVEAAPLDADDTDAGEQAVMAACAHKRKYVVWDGPSWYDPSYPGYVPFKETPLDGCFHLVSGRVTSTQIVCADCDETLATYKTDHILSFKGYHSFLFDEEHTDKCDCGQTKIPCNHSSYDEYSAWSEERYVNDEYHLRTDFDLEGLKVAQCKKCHLLGMNWDGSDKYGFGAVIVEGYFNYSAQLEKHTFVNGVCSKCRFAKSGSTTTATTVKLNAKKVTMGEKETFKLSATVKPTSKANSLRFKSSNTKVATVDAKTGKINAKKAGTATINAKIGSKTLATCKVTVKKAPNKISLNKSQVTLEKGKGCQLKATLPSGTYTSKLTWTSNNAKVAKVSSKGMVTAVGKGTATITVNTAGGMKATCKVTVKIPSKSTGTQKSSDFDGIKFYSGPQTYGDGYYTQTWFILESCQTAPRFINFSWDSNVQMLRREYDHPEYSVLRKGITQIQEYNMDQLTWSDGTKGSALALFLPDKKEIAGKQSIEFTVGEKTIIADIQLEYYPEEKRGEDWGFKVLPLSRTILIWQGRVQDEM